MTHTNDPKQMARAANAALNVEGWPETPTDDDLRYIGDQQREWTNRRDGAIIRAHDNGMSLRRIAEAVGLSHSAVARIVKRRDDG